MRTLRVSATFALAKSEGAAVRGLMDTRPEGQP
jgi:hypothetical protein